MSPNHLRLRASRRAFLTSAASGLGAAALADLLAADGRLAAAGAPAAALREPHFPPRARAGIFVFLAGGTSQLELFDPKPKLRELEGSRLPESLTRNQSFAFFKPETSKLMASRFGFRRYGSCGMELSELLPHIGSVADEITLVRSMRTDAFDHAPAEILFSTGVDTPGRPSAGAWVAYGLGSESYDLPAYVVLMTGRGPVSRSLAWGNAFLPASTGGVLFRERGEPLVNLESPPGMTAEAQRAELDTIAALNRRRLERIGDPRIAERIEAYELAFRMQAAAPELIDLSGESPATRAMYGTESRGEGRASEEARSFATNCLLARRLVERGVRFVSIFHRRWDQHSNLEKELVENCRVVDQPLGALVRDLRQRGLLDTTLVCCGTEFGRTPVTQDAEPGPSAGRDHHRLAFSLWMAGGGVRHGAVVGATDELGWQPVETPVHVHDFHATMLDLFGLDHRRLGFRSQGLIIRLTEQSGRLVKEVYA